MPEEVAGGAEAVGFLLPRKGIAIPRSHTEAIGSTLLGPGLAPY